MRLIQMMMFAQFIVIPLASFADDFGYVTFVHGERFEIAEQSWGHTLTGATCDLRITQIVKVLEVRKRVGEVDDVLFQIDQPESPRIGECLNGEKIILNLIQADTIRQNSATREKEQAEFDQVLLGKARFQSYQGLRVGDELSIDSWTWAILAAPTQNLTQKFREGDLCRIRENHKIEVLGFDPDHELSYFKYDGSENADFSDCPKGAVYLIRGKI